MNRFPVDYQQSAECSAFRVPHECIVLGDCLQCKTLSFSFFSFSGLELKPCALTPLYLLFYVCRAHLPLVHSVCNKSSLFLTPRWLESLDFHTNVKVFGWLLTEYYIYEFLLQKTNSLMWSCWESLNFQLSADASRKEKEEHKQHCHHLG